MAALGAVTVGRAYHGIPKAADGPKDAGPVSQAARTRATMGTTTKRSMIDARMTLAFEHRSIGSSTMEDEA